MTGALGKRVIVIGAGADSSILDVETGWMDALSSAGFSVYNYSLRNRLKLWTEVMNTLRHGMKCGNCASPVAEPVESFSEAGLATIVQAASECVIHEAVRHRASWALAISGCSFHPNAAAMLQSLGIPVITIVTEAPYNDLDMVDLIRVSTVTGVNERGSLGNYRQLAGQGALYLTTGYRRGVHEPGPAEPELASDVFFCGTGFEERARLFADTDWSGVDFQLAGFWPTDDGTAVVPTAEEAKLGQIPIGHEPRLKPYLVGGLMDNEEVVRRYRSAKIVLATHRTHPWAESIGPRVYEAAAVGAFQLCDNSRPELTDLFGWSVPTFKTGDAEDLGKQVRYWLDRPEERAEMAREARARVLHHSYDDRLAKLDRYVASLHGAGG